MLTKQFIFGKFLHHQNGVCYRVVKEANIYLVLFVLYVLVNIYVGKSA